MTCKLDARKSILDRVMDELRDGQHEFLRTDTDTIRVIGAKNNETAFRLARDMVLQANRSFNGHVTGFIDQISKYDPVTITFKPSDRYVDHVYDGVKVQQKYPNPVQADIQETYDANETGPNTNGILLSPTIVNQGITKNFYDTRVALLNSYFDRLSVVKNQKESVSRRTDLTQVRKQEMLTELGKKQRYINKLIYGDSTKNIKGLKEDLQDLASVADVAAVSPYVEAELARIEQLVNSNDIDDLREADGLIDFYRRAGIFDWNQPDINPMLSRAQIFKTDPNTGELTPEIANPIVEAQFKEWASRASNNRNRLNKKYDEYLVETVNSNPLVQKAFGTKLSLNEITSALEGLPDTDVISMWVTDVTSGIFSHNGVLPQVMFAELQRAMEEKQQISRRIAREIDDIIPEVEKSLSTLDGGKHTLRGAGILGQKGVVYTIFKDKTKDGNETGGLIRRFSSEYNSDEVDKVREFDKAMRSGSSTGNRRRGIDNYSEWRRQHSLILDLTKIPEIASDSAYDEFNAAGDTAYVSQLKSVLGEKGYNEEVDKMKNLLNKYLAAKEGIIDGLLDEENVQDVQDLSNHSLDKLQKWENWNNPVRGVEHYNSAGGRIVNKKIEQHGMTYNSFIPRQDNVNIQYSSKNNNWTATPTGASTGYYNEDFKKIEKDDALYKFYNLAKESCELIRDNTPYEIQQEMPAYTLMSLRKTSAEMLLDKNLAGMSMLSEAHQNMMDNIRGAFGVMEQSGISNANLDINGRPNYTVEDSFLRSHLGAINREKLIQNTNFSNAWNNNLIGNNQAMDVNQRTEIALRDPQTGQLNFNTETLRLLAEFTHTDISDADIIAGRIAVLENKIGQMVKVGKIIGDYAQHTIVQSQSFDLPKILKLFTHLTMEYAARQEVLPKVELMKKYYDGIRQPETNNISKPILNKVNGTFQKDTLRPRAMLQMASQFDRTFLGKVGEKHLGEWGKETKTLTPAAETKINTKIAELDRKIENLPANSPEAARLKRDKHKLYASKLIPRFGTKIYSSEEKVKLGELQELKEKNPTAPIVEDLEKQMKGLGKTRTGSAFLNNFLSFINVLKLGYNVGSGVTNYLEGLVSNMTLASQYGMNEEIFPAYKIMRASRMKNISTKLISKDSVAYKTRALADMFNVVVDSRSDLQKSSRKSFSNKLEWLRWSALNQRVEYVNQGVLMIASLRSTKIKGIDASGNEVESSVWDAYNNDGSLKDEFRVKPGQTYTQDQEDMLKGNVHNWENLSGDQYNIFKSTLDNMIIRGHGNYSQMRGMLAKTGWQKIFLMFKTYLPEALAWRFAKERPDILSGEKSVKGRYRSYTPGAAALHGAVLGAASFGFVGLGVGAAAGYIAARIGNRGISTGTSAIKDMLQTGKALALKAIGMPINMTAGREIVKDTNYYDSLVNGTSFTTQDAQNLKANVADIAMQLTWLLGILVLKGLLWDDDDKPDDTERIAHNIAVNKLMQLSTQAAAYTSLSGIYNSTIGSIGLVKFYDDCTKEITATEKIFQGDDVITTGKNAGESRVWNGAKRLLLPGIFKDRLGGFAQDAAKVYTESPFQPYFRGEAYKDEKRNKGLRAERRKELEDDPGIKAIEDDHERDKEIKKTLDYELPSPTRLKKMGYTRDQYEQQVLPNED